MKTLVRRVCVIAAASTSLLAAAESCIVSGTTARPPAMSGSAVSAAPVEAASAANSAPAASASAFDTRTGTEDDAEELIAFDSRPGSGMIILFR